MTLRSRYLLTCALAACLPTQAWAQEENREDQQPLVSSGQIVVTGERLRGQLDVEQAPVLELNEEDIAAVGATSVADLIAAISPQTGSSRGRGGARPVFLVNGIRINSFRELRSYPPEAIAKVEVMPEEVAQRFGFPPDRRVVNMILKENYSSREIELEFEGPDRGGYLALEEEFTYLSINDGARLNLNAEARDISLLTESERGVIQTDGTVSDVDSDPDPSEYRSLVPDSLNVEITANWAKALIDSGSQLSFNANYERDQRRSLSGLNSVVLVDPAGNSAFRTFGAADPLERITESDTYSASASWSKPVGDFQLTATADGVISDSETSIDRRAETQALIDAALAGTLAIDADLPNIADAGFDLAATQTYTSTNKLTLRGNPLQVPAGEVATTFDFAFDWKRIESQDTRTQADTQFTRRRFRSGANVVVPLAERGGAWGKIGDVSVSAGASYVDLSDFGTLFDWSAGLTWRPTRPLTLSATYIVNEVAPTLTQLGSPEVATLNVPVFDFVRSETVLATIISGGNATLAAETQKDWKFAANWELPFWDNTRFSVEYIRNRSSDVTSGFPPLTAEIEAAFPTRVTRDASGQLVSLDRRPVTFERTRAKRLVFGLTTRGNFGAARPQGREGAGGERRGGRPSSARAPGPRGERGPPSPERRAAFMKFRERVCAEDGAEVLLQLAQAIQRGDDISEQFPNFDRERVSRMAERFSNEDGTINRERLNQFRERICSFDPSSMRGRPGGGEGQARGRSGRGNAGIPGFGRRGGDGRGRYFANLTHTIELENSILIAQGLPELDLLNGDATSDGGLVRHSSRLEAGMFRNGWGTRISGRYIGKTRIDGTGLPGSSDLFFGDLATIDLRLFADLGRLLDKDKGPLKNFRVSLRADNIFDARRRVTDGNENVPISYQPFLIDPTGRFVGVDLRKLF